MPKKKAKGWVVEEFVLGIPGFSIVNTGSYCETYMLFLGQNVYLAVYNDDEDCELYDESWERFEVGLFHGNAFDLGPSESFDGLVVFSPSQAEAYIREQIREYVGGLDFGMARRHGTGGGFAALIHEMRDNHIMITDDDAMPPEPTSPEIWIGIYEGAEDWGTDPIDQESFALEDYKDARTRNRHATGYYEDLVAKYQR